MSASLRRNACPSLAAPMQTGDGLLVRLNTVSGTISPAALAAIAGAAERHGTGILEVTRRGSLQIRGLTAESSIALADDIGMLDLDLRTGVPVETNPLAGLDPKEIADPRPLAERIRTLIGKTGLAAGLGPKVSVVIDGGGQLSMRDVLADVRLTAISDDGGVRWQVAVGGLAATARTIGLVDKDDAAAMATGLLGAIADRGRIGRGKDLSEAEIEKVRVAPADEEAQPSAERQRLQSHMHAEPALKAANARTQLVTSPVGSFGLKNDRTAIGIGLPFGKASARQLNFLAQAAEEHGVPEFRLASGRALLAICDGEAAADAVHRAAARLGFVTNPADARLRIVACAGAPACASAYLATRQMAAELAAAPELADGLTGTIHVSGCEKRCAEPEAPKFTILGTPGGARILKGRDGTEMAFVARKEATVALRRVLSSAGVGGGASDRPSGRPNRKAG